jgi:hypothetical protein
MNKGWSAERRWHILGGCRVDGEQGLKKEGKDAEAFTMCPKFSFLDSHGLWDYYVSLEEERMLKTRGSDSSYYKSTSTLMFIAALFKIAKLWKQPRCPTTDEWIEKMWYLYTMEFYSVMKKNEILSFASKWMELENITLSKVNWAQKAKQWMFSLIYGL